MSFDSFYSVLDRHVDPSVSRSMRGWQAIVDPRTNGSLLVVYPSIRKVVYAPALAELCSTADDAALWFMAFKYQMLVRSVLGTTAHSHTEKMWELAWCLAWSCKLGLPTTTCESLFGSSTDVVGTVCSLRWMHMPDPPTPIVQLRSALGSYSEWMSRCPKTVSSDTTHQDLMTVVDASRQDYIHPSKNRYTAQDIPVVDLSDPHTAWLLRDLTVDFSVAARVPSDTDAYVVSSLLSLASDRATQGEVSYKYGHIGSREAVRIASGISCTHGRIREESRAVVQRVYLDVSRSMTRYAGCAWALATALPSAEFFVFSGIVCPCSPYDRTVRTDFSTDYDAVVTHILNNPVDEVWVLTDDDDSIDEALFSELDALGTRVVVLLTCPRSTKVRTFCHLRNAEVLPMYNTHEAS